MSRGGASGGGIGSRRWRRCAQLFFAGAILIALVPAVRAETFSHAALDSVLGSYLHDGRVDYGRLARDRGPLDRYLKASRAARLDGWSREEQIAFWVNVYNAHVLEGVIRRPGLRSVRDVGRKLGVPTGAFFRERFIVAGRKLSLDDIEHGILRAKFQEPRVHFVLNCASASCPVLPERALSGDGLDAELERATALFLTDRSRNEIDPARELRLSSIFKWYGNDFKAAAGSVPEFIERHWPGPARFTPGLPVHFLEYDWSLNGTW